MAIEALKQRDLLTCPECGTDIDPVVLGGEEAWTCRCGCTLKVWAFPAALDSGALPHAAEPVIGDEASCFYHADNQAVAPCARCGRYICAVCDVELMGAHYCPPCVEKAAASGALDVLKTRYRLPDRLALRVAMAPYIAFAVTFLVAAPVPGFNLGSFGVLFFMTLGLIGVFSAPAALVLGVQAYRNPEDYVIHRSAWRTHLALALSVTNLLLLVAGLVILMSLSMAGN